MPINYKNLARKRLPVQDSQRTGNSLKNLEKGTKTMLEKLHVLIVDDDPQVQGMTRDLSEMLLFAHELNIETANNAQEALMKLQRAGGNAIDVIVTDNSMPGMSGTEMAQQVRQNKYLNGIPIVMCTGDAEFERTKKVAIDSGVNVVLQKPYTAAQLKEAYQDVLPPEAFTAPSGTDSKSNKPNLVDTRDPDPGHHPEPG